MKPIILPGGDPMVRAFLEGRKTCFRVPIVPQPVKDTMAYGYYASRPNRYGQYGVPVWPINEAPGDDLLRYAKYQPGEICYLRETWCALWFSRDFETGYCDDWKEVALARYGARILIVGTRMN